MIRKAVFAIALVGLAFGFYLSSNFQLIAAGVAVLLFGMKFLENGFNSIATGPMYRLLKKVSKNFWLSFFLGFIATAVLQSSSLITIIAITFISTGLLSLRSGLGIVFGANLGTTSTAWIVAFAGLKLDISALALPLIVFGSLLYTRKAAFQNALGNILLGLGGFFMGIYAMQLGFVDVKGETFLIGGAEDSLPYLALAVLSGTVITAILNSSSATMAIIISALAGGQITYTQSLALAVGANIGSTFTAILGSINAKIDGKRLAIGHFIFNAVTSVLALAILPLFVKLVDKSADLLDINHSQLTLELALFHSMFNLLGILVLLPFVGKLERFLTNKIKATANPVYEAKYLLPQTLQFPQAAFTAVHNESKRVFSLVLRLIQERIDFYHSTQNKGFLEEINREELPLLREMYYEKIKPLLAQIQDYSAQLSDVQNTNDYSVVSRLIAEIIRDFDHMFKDVRNRELMENEFFASQFKMMLVEIVKTIHTCQQSLNDENAQMPFFEEEIIKVEKLNTDMINAVNAAISKHLVHPIIGTTALHNADYTKRIIKKMIRATRLIVEEKYLEKEASESLEAEKQQVE